MKYNVKKTPEFFEWFQRESSKSQEQTFDRLSRIERDSHFGDHKHIKKYLWELRWKNGRRIYYAYLPHKNLLVILGGNKNGQKQDINKAQKLLQKYA